MNIVDTYQGLETINPTVKAGTEELNFYSETGTYNRDNQPCVNFTIQDSFIESIQKILVTLNRGGQNEQN